jgi:hypothetical protein
MKKIRVYFQPSRDRLRILYPNGTVEYCTDFFHCGKGKYTFKWKRSCYSKSHKTALKSMIAYDKFSGFDDAWFLGYL